MFSNLKGQTITASLVAEVVKKEGVTTLFKKSYRFSKRTIFLLLPVNLRLFFAQKLKKFESDDVEEVINYSFSVLGGFIKPVQIHEEFKAFLEMLQEKNPKIVLEIGADKGGSLFTLCKLAPEDAIIISVDLPDGDVRGGYPKWKEEIFMMFKKPNQQLFLLRGDSHSEKMVTQVKEILNNEQIEFVFIDGDHSYDGVKKDFTMYSPLVSKGGVIAFHDVAKNDADTGVPMFWEETKKSYNTVEFIKDEQQIGYGIGCVLM
jgi:cephalosporin hydroxylase